MPLIAMREESVSCLGTDEHTRYSSPIRTQAVAVADGDVSQDVHLVEAEPTGWRREGVFAGNPDGPVDMRFIPGLISDVDISRPSAESLAPEGEVGGS